MKYIIGIDEVGRGPLAGPVTVGIVMCEEKIYKKLKMDKNLPPLGKDSKKLSPELRQKYAKILKTYKKGSPFSSVLKGEPFLSFTIVHISNKIIDTKGLSHAIKKAVSKGLKNLQKIFSYSAEYENVKVLLDGGLHAPSEFKNQKTIIKGDEKEKIIAWASILAKVSRDELMLKAHKKYPNYGFHKHKGYGTLAHRTSIAKYGFSTLHRKTFCKNIVIGI